MFDIHEFWLGFWTMIAVLAAGIYIIVYCSEALANAMYKTCDDLNEYIDTYYAATAKKLPMDAQHSIDV